MAPGAAPGSAASRRAGRAAPPPRRPRRRPAPPPRSPAAAPQPAAASAGMRRQAGGDPPDHRPADQQDGGQRHQRPAARFRPAAAPSAGDSGRPRKPRRRLGGGGLVDEAHGDHLDLVAAPLVEADGAAHQGGDARQLLRRAFAPARRGGPRRVRHAVHQHRDRQALAPPAARAACCGWSGRSRNSSSPPAGSPEVAPAPGAPRLPGRLVGDGGRAPVRCRGSVSVVLCWLRATWFSGSKRSSRGLDAVEIHLDRRLGADAAGAEAALQHLLDRAGEAQLLRPPHLLLVLRRGRAGQRLAAAGQQLAAAVDDGDVLRPQPGHRGGDQVQHRLHALAVQPLARPAWPARRWPGPRRAHARRPRAAAAPDAPGRRGRRTRPRMVRASSPSSARSRLTSC